MATPQELAQQIADRSAQAAAMMADLDRLVRATGNLEQAQKLQALALDVSAGSGKSLQAARTTSSLAQRSATFSW